MKKTLIPVIVSISLCAAHAQFVGGDLAVLRVGDGSTTLANTAGPLSLLDVTALGANPYTVNIPGGSTGLQASGTATSEGQLVLNPDHQGFTVVGYSVVAGSGSLSSRTSTDAPRGYTTVGLNGSLSPVTSLTGSYSGQNIRSGVSSGSGAWFTGSSGTGAGIVYYNGTSASQVQNVNSRVISDIGGDLYYSTGSGTKGIYKYSGLPTGTATSTAFLTGVTGQGSNPYDFVLSPDGQTLYVADSDLGVQKFSFNGSACTLDYNFTDAQSGTGTKAFGLAVDFSGVNPILYWTSPDDVWTATDAGAGVSGSILVAAGSNYAFRGLELVPTPEPTTLALSGLGLAAMAFAARRKNK